MVFTIAIPAPLIKTAANIAMQIQMQQMQPDFLLGALSLFLFWLRGALFLNHTLNTWF